MKFATMATGGIGGFLAVHLANAGHEVATIARGDHLNAIRKNGLSLATDDGTQTVTPWIATDDPVEVGPVDCILFGVKGDSLESAAELCAPMIGPRTAVIPFLNGVEAADRLVAVLDPENVANGVAYVSTTISEPGVIKQTGVFNKFVIAERDSEPSARMDAIREAFTSAGVNAPGTDDIDHEIWSKFVLFSAMSGVTAAGRCTIGDIVSDENLSALFQTVLAETAALARAKGIAVGDTFEDDCWENAKTFPAPMRASTAIDLEAGRPLEADWITGAVVRLSAEHKLEAPANRTIYALLSPYIRPAAT